MEPKVCIKIIMQPFEMQISQPKPKMPNETQEKKNKKI